VLDSRKRVSTITAVGYSEAVRLLKSGEPIETVLRKLGLSETTWEDAKEKYLKPMSRANLGQTSNDENGEYQ